MTTRYSLQTTHSQRGFTLIEMLVVASLVALLSGVLIANYPKTSLRFLVTQSAYKFAQDVRRAQTLTLSSFQYKDSNGVLQPIAGYGIYAKIADPKKYLIYGNHTLPYATVTTYDPDDYVVETIDFSQISTGVIISQIDGNINQNASSVSINFDPPNPHTALTLSGSMSQDVVTITFASEIDPTVTKTVVINIFGLVEVK